MRSSEKTKGISFDTFEAFRDGISAKCPVPFGFHPDGRETKLIQYWSDTL